MAISRIIEQYKVGRRVVASIVVKWHPYNRAVIKIRSKNGVIPKGGYYSVFIKAGAGCKKYMEELLALCYKGQAKYEWPQFPAGSWNYDWKMADGMNLWLAVYDMNPIDEIDPAVIDEAKRLFYAYIAANPNYFK